MTTALDSSTPTRASDRALAGQAIALIGASGQLGRELVPALCAAGAELALFGRNPLLLRQQFPGFACAASVEFKEIATSRPFVAVIDLATINSATDAPLAEYRAVNVARPDALAAEAQAAGVPLFISLSSTHAIDPAEKHPYAVSKREARVRLLACDRPGTRLLVLPKIVVARPGSARARLWTLLGVLKPVALFPDVVEAIIALVAAGPGAPRETYIAPVGERAYAALSRALDFFLALAILVGAGWLMLLLALAVKVDGRGPAIFAQRRVGLHEAPFTLYKFRTMPVGTREAGTHELTTASVTRVGTILRRLKLDELPQVINILRGELALVGPRPCLPIQRELVERRRAAGVFALRPGLTGLAQINGIDMSQPATLVEWEVRYMRLRRLLLDLRIIGETFVGRGKGDRTSA